MSNYLSPSNLDKPSKPDGLRDGLRDGLTDGVTDGLTDGLTDGGVHQQALADRMAQGAHHTIDRLSDSAAPAVDRMEEVLSDATGQLKIKARQLREVGDEWADGLRGTVQRNPLTSLVAAIGVGLVIARIRR